MTSLPFDLVVGTGNRAKGGELTELLQPLGIAVTTLLDLPDAIEVDETGTTFAENARLKAVQQAQHLGRWVLADDSGIEVEALQGRPGVYSARYAGSPCDNHANNQKLLQELGDLPVRKRAAQYACWITLADPQGQIRAEAEGICRGRITNAPAGSGGFGYDPIFEIPELHRTFGQLGPAVKRALSHRARAMRAILPQLRRLTRTGAWQ